MTTKKRSSAWSGDFERKEPQIDLMESIRLAARLVARYRTPADVRDVLISVKLNTIYGWLRGDHPMGPDMARRVKKLLGESE
jgi:hypothetical protein